MAKKQKKRTKKYQGSGAAHTHPSVTRIQAVNRTGFGQWWFEKKRIVRPIAIASGVIVLIVWLVTELFRAVLQ